MFDVLVFLYENYSALSACPDFESLTRRLADAGFDEDEIADAMVWLHGLASVTLSSRMPDRSHPQAFRVYTSRNTLRWALPRSRSSPRSIATGS